MSSAQLIPAHGNGLSTDVPLQDALDHQSSAAPDPEMIARLANAFFLLQPHQAPPAPTAPGAPVATPAPPEPPAPSVVTTAAPLAPARAPFGPPDLPPTTIPSVVPTPNVAIPAAPTHAQPGSRPLGLPDPPQPGASLGSAQLGSPNDIDYSLIPRLFGEALALTSTTRTEPLPHGLDSSAAPAGVSAPQADNLYFLHDRASLSAPGTSPATERAGSEVVVRETPIAARETPGAFPENFAVSAPSDSDPHRISDVASFASPPTPAPIFEGYESSASPGAAGPAGHDALYFIGHSGGHEGAFDPAPAQAKDPVPQGYEPRLAGGAESARQPFDPYRVKRDFPILQQQVHGKPLIWLDNAATTQKPQAVIDQLRAFLRI